ncbi:hypothetical protein CV_3091 [Chromobacterium violaceum ATCC 12472]|uniref:Uncharacterized protein n=1 Tax=Chromobacterium violaceum (strain ATCC 12472 / DSM 30191 / JCM 1249 / CCUG 213 / NBRC 12614 / NCIMB 9131 / NCTC 9757 / MK) TaxID=243365 RepID=Q7NTG5_CHRVO|nr:hypothetical protein CV_3091 [Chromobacterium violaceum ATCC 12472]
MNNMRRINYLPRIFAKIPHSRNDAAWTICPRIHTVEAVPPARKAAWRDVGHVLLNTGGTSALCY